MPRRKSYTVARRRTHRRRGGSFWGFLKKANSWLRRSGAISKVANALGSAGVPFASKIGSVAGTLGYGRRRRGRGGALVPAGGMYRMR